MSFTNTLPPTMMAKKARSEETSDEPQKRSREDYKKMKELEEARKAGTVPAMQDEEGKDINPHIPQYIMQVPWYYGLEHATLTHQRPQQEFERKFSEKDQWYKKGVKEGPIATKFRKGACENCGAMTHKKKDCLERPRKIGAKYTGEKFAPDEHIQNQLSFDYEGKRDRWNGYNPEEHQRVYENFEKLEEAKRLLKEQTVEQEMMEEEGKDNTITKDPDKKGDDSDDEDKYADDVDMPGQKFETKQRITVRNLRIREDTAKYLFNLDVSSAFYDPKTRSMRDNPLTGTGREMEFTGDNFARFSGDAQNFAKKQMFAWDAYEHGSDVHLQADPTKLELLAKEVKKREQENKVQAKSSILEKYGGEEHLEAPPKQLLLAQTEDYVEYSRHGTVIKGAEKPVIRSKYQEDVYINNHTSVWGSFWLEGRWGFKCCCSTIKESYCVGQAGVEAAISAQQSLLPVHEDVEEEQQKSLLELHQSQIKEGKKKKKKKKNKHRKKKKRKRSSSSSDESSEEDDDSDSDSERERKREKKLRKALKKETEHQRKVEEMMSVDERKRSYNSMYEAKAPTEEEMEAWRMKRGREEDPMANFL